MIYFSSNCRDPTPSPVQGDTKWHQFVPQTSDYLHIGSNDTRMRQHLRPEKMAFWNDLMRKLLNKHREKHANQRQTYWTEMTALAVTCAVLATLLLFSIIILLIRKRPLVKGKHPPPADTKHAGKMEVNKTDIMSHNHKSSPTDLEDNQGKSNGEPLNVRL